jgi:hypothetical protein
LLPSHEVSSFALSHCPAMRCYPNTTSKAMGQPIMDWNSKTVRQNRLFLFVNWLCQTFVIAMENWLTQGKYNPQKKLSEGWKCFKSCWEHSACTCQNS